MRKNSLAEGTIIAYAAIVITKLLGALYSIPFYNIIGDQGGVIYSCAYNIYALFLDISTSGIPVAVSIVISEYNAQAMYQSKERAYSVALRLVWGLSLVSFLILQVFARQIGLYFLGDMTDGVSPDAIAAAVRVVSICLLVAPVLSVKRGYLQGHKFLAAPSQSQVLEQLVRIAVVLAGTYVTVRVLKLSTTVGVCLALFGAALGSAAALLYLQRKSRQIQGELHPAGGGEDHPASTREILRKVFFYCITIVIMSVSISIYSLVDMKMLMVGLHNLDFPDQDVQVIASIASTWIPKICMLITALSMGMVSSLAPHMAESNTQGDSRAINRKLNRSLEVLLLAAVPLGMGMILLAEPIFRMFYGSNPYGGPLLQMAVVVNVVGSMVTVTSMSMQSIGRGRVVCFVTLVGIVLNAALDLPLIYLFDAVGIPAYLGASAASIVGQSATLGMLLWSLRGAYGFRYAAVLRTLGRVILPTAGMAVVVLALEALWPVTGTRGLLLVAQLLAYAILGGGVYLLLALKTGTISAVIGADTLRNLFEKMKHRRNEK